MKYWQVNRIHPDSIIEEVLRINLEAETSEEAIEILTHYGYEVIDINEEWEKIKVKQEDKKMTKMELVKEYIKSYIKDNHVTGDNVQRLYNEAWEVCKESLDCTKSMFMTYMRGQEAKT